MADSNIPIIIILYLCVLIKIYICINEINQKTFTQRSLALKELRTAHN